MDTIGRTMRSSLLRALKALLLVALTLGPSMAHDAMAAQTTESRLDLAAVALRPVDLEQQGLEGYGTGNGLLTNDPQAAGDFLAHYRGDPGDAGTSALGGANPGRIYVLNLVRPGVEGDSSSGTRSRVVTYLLEFDDEPAAQTAFAILAAGWQAGEMQEEPTTSTVGQERILVSGFGQEEWGERGRYQRRDLMFRSDQLIAGVSVESYSGPPSASPVVEALAAAQLVRIQEALATGGPGMSNQVLRLQTPGANSIWDRYNVLSGQPNRLYDQTAEEATSDRALFKQWRIVDEYQSEQQIVGEANSSVRPLVFYGMRLILFADVDAASAFLATTADRLRAQSNRQNLQVVEDVPEIADQVAGFTSQITREDGVQFQNYRLYVRSGDMVVMIALTTTEELDQGSVNELAGQQIACLQGNDCTDPIPVPATLGGATG